MSTIAKQLGHDLLLFACGLGFLLGMAVMIVCGVVRLVWDVLTWDGAKR